MKNYPWILLTGGLLGMAFAQGACGGGGSGGAGGGAGGTATTSSSSSSTSTSTSSSGTVTTSSSSGGTGGAGDCSGLTNGSDCGLCVEMSCCTDLSACLGDQNCTDCLSGAGTGCDTDALVMALTACQTANCDTPCNPKSECNPVTNEGCTGAGEACDLSGSGVYVCFPPPNDAAMCADCSNSAGPFCAPGFHCNEDMNGGKCTHYCCTNADCGTGTCDMTTVMLPNGVGICVGMADGGATLASCDSPATPPSGGTCFTP